LSAPCVTDWKSVPKIFFKKERRKEGRKEREREGGKKGEKKEGQRKLNVFIFERKIFFVKI
jgi:hypothetical protein